MSRQNRAFRLYYEQYSLSNVDRAPMGQLNLIGTWSWSGPETSQRAIDLLYQGRIGYGAMVTSRYKLEQW